ncbi:uncharacterized protein E0L32_009363 [Thyridium curvatum]|uniref:ATP-dependent DNA helicase PIF1 n=1 Tax=Thyridium curvatum TaxID=1093900 RepID=A0A507AHL1_9PEZI|nr:uncharacterized protein E0L32_009363 [Thyridium curvatum]TPX09475.1 hypothetical protein E0L32_009363 [Thyridium curvatum]
MLSRAVQSAGASDQSAPNHASKAGLAKELFPSSSPNPHDGNIADHFKKHRPSQNVFGVAAAQAASSFNRSHSAGQPLKPRSGNFSKPPSFNTASSFGSVRSSNSSRAITSLCGKTDSFKDEPDVIDLVNPAPQSQRNPVKTAAPVYIAEDDFSDDDDLDLDFERPSALPQLPPQLPTLPRTTSAVTDPHPASGTSALSWSQSSPSHYRAPPQRPPRPAAPQPPKRAASDADSIAAPKAKKRALPKSWQRPAKEEYIDVDEYQSMTVTTPAPKPKDVALWDATASAVKEQKKQLKNQSKKPTQVEPPKPVEPTAPQAVKSHAVVATNHAISLSNEQRHVKSLVCDKNQSVFFTGPAGTGKSVLMRAIIQEMKKKWLRDPERLAVTASTGLAACNIGGMTLHSFSGIGLGKEDVQQLVKKIRRNPKAKNRWLRTKTLIIDEVSMVDGELFDKLSQIGRIIRNNGRPWGGIQLVITGDFFQLPPVPDGDKKREVKFAFEAATWNTSIDHTIGLTEVFRQKDPVFANMLNEMRLGRISEQTVESFKKLARPLGSDDGLEVTELFPTRNEVEASNSRRLAALGDQAHRFDAFDSGDPAVREKLLANMMAPKAITLKKGAQVMLIKNMDETLVNGSLGTVMGFMSESTFELTGAADGYGSGGEEHMDPNFKKRVAAFSRQLDNSSSGSKAVEYPLVRFHAVDGTSRTLLCVPEEWKVELPTGEVQACRKQLPLILAWALSIHKAQGQTLERVKVDLGKVFEKGQAYVALSRATSQQGLQVLRFEKHKVMAHPRVVQFYNKLYSAETALKKRPTAMTSQPITNFTNKAAMPSARSGSITAFAQRKDVEVIDLEEEEAAMAAYGY